MNKLKDALTKVFQDVVGDMIFYQNALQEKEYPYYVYDLRRIDTNNSVDKYILEINAWDKHHTSSRIEEGMDNIDSLNGFKQIEKSVSFVFVIYKGKREPIDDEDKGIKRIREEMELTVIG